MNLDELKASWLVTGEGVGGSTWDAEWRGQLVENLGLLIAQLKAAGYGQQVFAAGSFVERKPRPGDIDGYFRCPPLQFARGEVQAKLKAVSSAGVNVWEWDTRIPDPITRVPHTLMWHIYKVDLRPETGRQQLILPIAPPQTWEQFFRHTRTGEPKGILQVMP